MKKVEMLCGHLSPFEVTIGKPGWFGKEVLYLSGISEEIYHLHYGFVNIISTSEEMIKKYFEKELYTPHLTIGTVYHGNSIKELEMMEKQLGKNFEIDIKFKAKFIRVYESRNNNGASYVKLTDFNFLSRFSHQPKG
ncbi:2'-5' RNA ligase family protein [Brevibacillus sp. SYP-B805]|uniref:2'-5' RNA ligase family protein n=1 Tax=Brevibacillus sp. SYP-B805 TaxID=1578199 RepID=UPI0013EDC85D|nr:2'-5' RNA ligase family protein [Brevibacillus sp. SYP-B805]NGQ95392.1 2'-5' RNA ligase family protein [Brevibacillus sp. SYP-B805]